MRDNSPERSNRKEINVANWVASGPWSAIRIEDYLSETRIPIRLACIDGDGVPRIVSLWFEWAAGAFCCATQNNAAVARWLRERPQVGFEVSSDLPPYSGIRGTGVASLDRTRGGPQLRKLLDRYGVEAGSSLRSSLLAKEQSEVCIRVQPDRIASWDYTERMKDVS